MSSWETLPRSANESEGVLRVLEAIGSNLELRQVLYRLVDATIEVTGADRSLILLLQDNTLVPGAIATRHPNVEHFQRFRRLDPIPLDGALRSEVESGEIFFIPSLAATDLTPDAWKAFGDRSLALAPLAGAEDDFGLLVVDHPAPYDYPEEELRLIQAIAQMARIAIGNAGLAERLDRKIEMQNELGTSLARIGSEDALREVLGSIAESISRLLGGRSCSITFGDDTVTSGDTKGNTHRTSIPLRTDGGLLGFITIRGDNPVGHEELDALQNYALHATLAIDRARLAGELKERDWRGEATARLADLLIEPGELDRVIRRLNASVCLEAGLECQAVAFRRRRLAALLGVRTLDPGEHTLAARMAAERVATVQQVDPDGLHAAPLLVSGRVAGLLFVRPTSGRGPLNEPQRSLVAALAARIGEVTHKARLQAALQEAESRLTLAASHRRVLERIERTLGGPVEALWQELSAATAHHRESPEVLRDLSRLRSLAARTLMAVHTSVESAAVLGVRRDGFHEALRSLLRSFEALTDTSTTLRTERSPVPLPLELEERLYSIAFDVLWAIERSGRATTVVLTLTYDDGVRLTVRDDGRGLAERGVGEGGPGAHFGVRSIQERVADVGGTMTIEATSPRGVRLEIHVPRVAVPDRPARPKVVHTPSRLRQYRERHSYSDED